MAAQDNLKVFAIAGRTASGAATAVDDVDQEELRLPIGALLTKGFLPNLLTQAANANAFRVRQNTGSDMNLLVGSGTSKVDGYVVLGTVAGQGAYILRLDATTKTVSVPATDATNPARYGVYAYIDDTAYSGTASRAYANVSCIRGTPAGSPTTPGPLAAWSAYVLLWEFQLPANASAVTNTILDSATSFDRRVPSSPLSQFVGVKLRRAALQTLTSGVQATISWDTEDFDTFRFISAPGTTLTVPAGLGGMYLLSYVVTPSSGSLLSHVLELNLNALREAIAIPELGIGHAVTWGPRELAAGDTIVIKETQSSGSDRNITARLVLQQISI